MIPAVADEPAPPPAEPAPAAEPPAAPVAAPVRFQFYDVLDEGVTAGGRVRAEDGGNAVVCTGGGPPFCLTTDRPFGPGTLRCAFRTGDPAGDPWVGVASTEPDPAADDWTAQIPRAIEVKLSAGKSGANLGALVLPTADFRAAPARGSRRTNDRWVMPARAPALNGRGTGTIWRSRPPPTGRSRRRSTAPPPPR